MRLSDLVRHKEKKSKQAVPPPDVESGAVETDAGASSPQVRKKTQVSAHLGVGDLAAMYDLTSDRLRDVPQVQGAPRRLRNAAMEAPIADDVIANSSPNDDASAVHVGEEPEEALSPSEKYEVDMPDSEYDDMEDNELSDALHIELLSYLDDIYEDGREGVDIGLERVIDPLLRAIQLLKGSNAMLRKAVRLKKGQRSFTTHSLNVTILAIKIGLIRGFSDERVFSLALCALMGDIGMTRVDTAILNKSSKLTPEEFMEIKRHVEYSVDIVKTVESKFPFLVPIVHQLHERENGNGYPQGVKGSNIHEFAKIIGMCDVYVALTEPKANREHYSGYVAMQQIISHRGIDFDPKIIKSLIDVISVFPLESLVRLNNGAIGRVIDISAVHPTRPKLSVLISSDGEKLRHPKLLDLETEPLLYIENPDIEEGVVL